MNHAGDRVASGTNYRKSSSLVTVQQSSYRLVHHVELDISTLAPAQVAPSVSFMQLQLTMTDSMAFYDTQVTPVGGYDIDAGRFRAVAGSFVCRTGVAYCLFCITPRDHSKTRSFPGRPSSAS